MQNLFSYEGKRCLFAGLLLGHGRGRRPDRGRASAETIVAADIKQAERASRFESFSEVDLRDPAAIDQLVDRDGRGRPDRPRLLLRRAAGHPARRST